MYLVHDVPGRLRVKLEKLRNNPYRLKQVQDLLAIEGVHRVKSSPVTGSVVVEYDNLALNSGNLIDLLNSNGYDIAICRNQQKVIESHEKIAMNIGRATFSWVAGMVLEANGLACIAALI